MKNSDYLLFQAVLITVGINILAADAGNSNNADRENSLTKSVSTYNSDSGNEVILERFQGDNDEIGSDDDYQINSFSLQERTTGNLLEERSRLYAEQRESSNKSVETSKASERQVWICKINQELEFRGKQSETAKRQIEEANQKEEEESEKCRIENEGKRIHEQKRLNNSGNISFFTKIRNGFFNFLKAIACCFYTAE